MAMGLQTTLMRFRLMCGDLEVNRTGRMDGIRERGGRTCRACGGPHAVEVGFHIFRECPGAAASAHYLLGAAHFPERADTHVLWPWCARISCVHPHPHHRISWR